MFPCRSDCLFTLSNERGLAYSLYGLSSICILLGCLGITISLFAKSGFPDIAKLHFDVTAEGDTLTLRATSAYIRVLIREYLRLLQRNNVSNPFCSPRFRLSASGRGQLLAFAFGVPNDINGFHPYTVRSCNLSSPQVRQYRTQP